VNVRLSSVSSGRRLLGAAGCDLPDASIIDSSSIRITSERDRRFESCFLQRGVRCEPDFRLPSPIGTPRPALRETHIAGLMYPPQVCPWGARHGIKFNGSRRFRDEMNARQARDGLPPRQRLRAMFVIEIALASDGLFGNLECERLRLCRHGDLVWLWFEAIDRALASPCSHRFALPSSGEPVRPLQQGATAERLAVCNCGVDRARNSPPQGTGFRRPVMKATPCGPTCSA
jgi:hypothetical protein